MATVCAVSRSVRNRQRIKETSSITPPAKGEGLLDTAKAKHEVMVHGFELIEGKVNE